MSNNNPTGINGYGAKNYPPDDVLSKTLHQYAKEKLSVKDRLLRLYSEHGLDIKPAKLHQLNKKFDVPSVRKPPPNDVATQAVMEQVAEDTAQRNGVAAIATLLNNKGIAIPRDTIRQILSLNAPEGLASRFPGRARKIERSSLAAIGPNQQHHADGHDKLNAQALNMGGVGLLIYGIKDQWSSFILHMVVVPNNRLATTIGHVHADYIEKYGMIPITLVLDKGSEVGWMYANQTGLRAAYTPDIDSDEYPAILQIKSVNNTPIEGVWHWLLKTCELNIKVIIRNGYLDGTYNPNNPIHPQLFYWLWPKVLQRKLDEFVEYWNNHRIRSQVSKPNMSGHTPRHAFTVPAALGVIDCRINVDFDVVEQLRERIPVSRNEAMQWVSQEFEAQAQNAYETVGMPELDARNAWQIFSSMSLLLLA